MCKFRFLGGKTAVFRASAQLLLDLAGGLAPLGSVLVCLVLLASG